MESFKVNWPTPGEAMASQKAVQHPTMDYSNNHHHVQSQTGLQMNISFLQPSVVYSPSQCDNYVGIEHASLDNIDFHAPTPNIHLWAGYLEEYNDVAQQLHPAILSQLKPCKTQDDHNCLYNAICLCLGIPESKQDILREQTALCLQRHSDHFKKLLEASVEISLQSLIKQCKQPSCFEGWGNEFHILALAIMLKRNIIVYTTFKSPKGQFYQRKNKNIVGLAEEFTRGGEKIKQHINFEPQKGINSHNPIFIYLHGNHFTALVPRLPNPIYCIPPAINLPSIPHNGIPSHTPDTTTTVTKLTRKARWLASKTPAQLDEHKAMKKAKRKEKKTISGIKNMQDTVDCRQNLSGSPVHEDIQVSNVFLHSEEKIFFGSLFTGLHTQKAYAHTGTFSSQCVHQICSCIYSICQILLLLADSCMHLYCN